MPTYMLTLVFNPSDLQTIYAAGEQVVIARRFSDSESNVAWLCFKPFETNVVGWEDQYGLYASQTSGMVTMSAKTGDDIPSGTYYNMTSSGFEGPFSGDGAPPPDSYRAFNQMTDYPVFGFGVIQAASVNGAKVEAGPATAVEVPMSQFATFTPVETLYVWLQSNVAAGDKVAVPPPGRNLAAAQVGSVSSPSTEIRFGGGVVSLAYRYDAKTATFLPAS